MIPAPWRFESPILHPSILKPQPDTPTPSPPSTPKGPPMPPLLIDTHCHLNHPPLNTNPAAVLQRAQAQGVTRVITPAYDRASWLPILDLARNPGIFPALGLHPWVADQCPTPQELQDALAQAIATASQRVVAIGEIGLDTKIENADLPQQMAVLKAQLALAADLDLPVILHCRGAFHDLVAAVKAHGGRLRGVVHAWTRGPELVQAFYPTGLLFGLGGAVTRPNAKQARRAAKVLPLSRIVLETDAPSIGLQGVRPEETEPRHVADVAAALAAIKEEDLATVAAATTRNAEELFGPSLSGKTRPDGIR
ncbi:DNAase [bacterium DOLZORAL124_64_63]|nr:MAG: DNAase [bacterium DOLZORAL124_64_63]